MQWRINSEGKWLSACSRGKTLGSWAEFENTKFGELHFGENLMMSRSWQHQKHLRY
jgi:hypothetical protein